jgi:hypothetical protein
MRRRQLPQSSILAQLLALAILAVFILLVWPRLNEPFWLDDSWTANSVREPELSGMLRYEGWMQHTPPLFLFVLRWGVSWAGQEWIWRLIPLSGTLAAAGLFWRFLRRETGQWWALAGLTLALFAEATIQQAVAIRSYSWETALGVLLLEGSVAAFRRPAPRRFALLYATACLLVVSGYSAPLQIAAATVLPAWAVWLRRRRPEFRRLLAALVAGASAASLLFVIVYATMLAPNIGPSLREYWFTGTQAAPAEQLATLLALTPGSRIATLAPLVFLAAVLACLPLLLIAFRRARARDWLRNAPAAAAWAMIAAAAAAHIIRVVPLSPRGGVYLTPWCVVAVLTTLRMGSRLARASLREAEWRRLGFSLLSIVVLGAFVSAATRLHRREQGRENFRIVVADLQARLSSGDRLIVHPTTREQFKYYARAAGFLPEDIVWGDTAWPCCVPGKTPFQAAAEERLAAEAFPAGRPRPKRIFLMVLAYDWFWERCGADERPRWKAALEKRGCALNESRAYGRADLMVFSCNARAVGHP